MYNGLIEKISQEATKYFDAILATHNFENGNEFEVALCKILRLILPKKYSICRGYIVAPDGSCAGDDIIIYDAYAFPKVRLIEDELAIKQYIPFEAVYAYIEAKHTLYLEDDDVIGKAFNQINKVKSLSRVPRSFEELDGYKLKAGLNTNVTISSRKNWPDYWNPLFTCIISRYFKKSKKDTQTGVTQPEIINSWKNKLSGQLDLILFGEKFVGLPCINGSIYSPFFIEGKSDCAIFESDNSIGVAFSSLMWALENIKLAPIDYPQVIAKALDITVNKEKSI